MKTILPNPEELQARRLAIQQDAHEKKQQRLAQFCEEELSPRIIAANEKLETKVVFSLPSDISASDFERYIAEMNLEMSGKVAYTVEIHKNDIRLSWIGQK